MAKQKENLFNMMIMVMAILMESVIIKMTKQMENILYIMKMVKFI